MAKHRLEADTDRKETPQAFGVQPMTLTDKIAALLAADPACNGRVTGDTVRAIAGLVSERDAEVTRLRSDLDHYRKLARRGY